MTCWACRYYPVLFIPVLRRYYPVLLVFLRRYYQLKADTSSAQSFTLLKNFFTYVDDLEYHVFNKRIEKVFSTILKLIYWISRSISKFAAQGEFKQAVEKITGLKITDRESEYLFRVWPWNINLYLMFFNQWPNINLYLIHQNIFKMVDANHDGIIDAENELNLHKHRTPEYATYAREQTEILLNDQNHAWVFSIFFNNFVQNPAKLGHSGSV